MSLARTILEQEVPGGTLVIHMEDPSTDFLKAIYAGKGYPVISQAVHEKELMSAIEAHSRIFMLGHGSPNGLFARLFLIDKRFGPALSKKESGLYIWCHADAYAKHNQLSGLASGMFISEVSEARYLGVDAAHDEIEASNALFSRTVRALLDTGAPLSGVREGYTHATCKVTQFNNERLYIFEKGVPSPALHKTSLAHLPPLEIQPLRLQLEPEDDLRQRDFGWDRWDNWYDWWKVLDDLATEQGIDLDYAATLADECYDRGFSPEQALRVIRRLGGRMR